MVLKVKNTHKKCMERGLTFPSFLFSHPRSLILSTQPHLLEVMNLISFWFILPEFNVLHKWQYINILRSTPPFFFFYTKSSIIQVLFCTLLFSFNKYPRSHCRTVVRERPHCFLNYYVLLLCGQPQFIQPLFCGQHLGF